MPAGRPTDYGPETLEAANWYLDNYDKENVEVVPTVAGLALHLGVSRETVYAWAKDKEKTEFSDIVNKLSAKREVILVSGGLKGQYNPTITSLMMGQLGYHKEHRLDVTSRSTVKIDPDMKPEDAAKAYQDLMDDD